MTTVAADCAPPSAPLRFLAVGAAGLAVDTLVFQALTALGPEPAWARLGSLGVATAATWVLNRRFTFAPTGRRRRDEIARYGVVTLVAQGLSYGVFLALLAFTPALPPQAALLIGAVLAAGASYAGQRLFTFAAPAGAAP